MISKEFWANKRVLITGHTGFKGAWLALVLNHLGAKLAGLSHDIPTSPSLFELAEVKNLLEDFRVDIRDLESLKDTIESFKPQIVFHLAAQALVRDSYQNPEKTYSTNIMGTVNLLEALRQNKNASVCINVTTDKCYENREWHWGYREIDQLGGHDPYSSSKACSEIISAAYRRSFFSGKNSMALATARAGNVIGGGDWAQDRLIPDIFKGWLANKTITIRNPGSIRPWQHVLEAIHGYILLAEKLARQPEDYAEAWNFGPYESDAKPVGWIAEKLQQSLPNMDLQMGSSDNLHEAAYLKLDCSKARAQLGWEPQTDLCTAINMIIEWYEAYKSGRNIRQHTLQQIKEYMDKLTK
jgi:CDP-glucose 4,6-dehydratase